jgi:hypothetical protein
MTRTSRWRRVRQATHALTGAALALVLCSLTPTRSEHFTSERMGARVRVLKSCGKKKACLVKARTAAAEAASPPADAEGSSLRVRWRESEFDDVTVWIASGDSVPHWRASNRYLVRDAFHAWTAAGAPVHFVFVSDSARADVHVLWRDSLPETRAGQVTRVVDHLGWVRAATIEMNTRSIVGGAQDASTVRAVALHEVGHLLGLEHSRGERDIMSSWVTATKLSRADRAAMRALYDASANQPTR